MTAAPQHQQLHLLLHMVFWTSVSLPAWNILLQTIYVTDTVEGPAALYTEQLAFNINTEHLDLVSRHSCVAAKALPKGCG